MGRSWYSLAGAILLFAAAVAGQNKPVSTPSGLKFVDQTLGKGQQAKNGDTVRVHYTGWLYDKGARGKKFDSSKDRNKPFDFRIGEGKVIKGWEEGVKGMRVGGKRELIIPPTLGYGSRGFPGAIPPNSTLNFEIELIGIKQP